MKSEFKPQQLLMSAIALNHRILTRNSPRLAASLDDPFCAISAWEPPFWPRELLYLAMPTRRSEGSWTIEDISQMVMSRFSGSSPLSNLIEADLWQQSNELGGVDAPDSGYKAGLVILDGDQPQYISDNTDDELSHAAFLNAYLASKGEQEVDLRQFATLQPSQVSFVPQTGRLTNLKQLTVDTSWWTRYRSTTNPDFGAIFRNAVPSLDTGLHSAIPRNNNELGDPNNPSDHVKAIGFTAGFHFGFIEQGGTSLYATLAQKVTSLEVLRILLSIGGSEIMHFQTWQDKAGNATPLTDFDPINNSTVTFTDLTTGQPETLQANLIMPEPCEFISPKLSCLLNYSAHRSRTVRREGRYQQLRC